MKLPGLLVLGAGILISGCKPKADSARSPATNAPKSGNPITAPVDYLGVVVKAQQNSARTIDLTSLTQAIQLFNAQEERFPQNLNELVTQRYLGRLPAPPPGMKFDYNPQTGQLKVVKQ
jgi:hypothetical protein